MEERKIIGMKYPSVIPEGYRCDKCRAHGVKLWCGDEIEDYFLRQAEFIPSSVRKLLCSHCAEADQRKKMFDSWKSEFILNIHGGTDIGILFPALPVNGVDNLFYGLGAPSFALIWWRKLPASKPEARVYEKKLRLDVVIPEYKLPLFIDEFRKLFLTPEYESYSNKTECHIQVVIYVHEERKFFNFLESFCEDQRIRLQQNNITEAVK